MSDQNLPYQILFSRFGIRSPQYLLLPKMPLTEAFFFPKNSIHHFVPLDGVAKYPASDEFLYRNIDKKIFVNHVTDLSDKRGEPRKSVIPVLPLIRDFHIKNKRFRPLDDPISLDSETSLIVINYGFASINYRYVKTIYAEYFKWWNLEKTLWTKVAALAQKSNRHQFIFSELPKTLPSIPSLNIYSKLFDQSLIKRFNTPESLFLLEIWKWLSVDNREQSIIGNISNDNLKKINIVFQESGRFVVLNLGELNSWRKESDIPKENRKFQEDAIVLQKKFLRLMMVLMENRTVIDVDSIENEINELEERLKYLRNLKK